MEKQIACKNCGQTFLLSERQKAQYAKSGWHEPAYCNVCAERRQQERERRYFGLQEATANRTSCKRRRQRVHYPVHIVGGFR